MKANGFALCGAIALPLLLAATSSAEDWVQPTGIEQAVVSPTSLDASIADASDDTVLYRANMGCERDPFWFAGAEMLFLHVNADTGGRITLAFNDSGTVGTDISFDSGTGLFDYAAAPRLTVGRQFGEKWGVVGRYFSLDDSRTGFPNLTPGTTPLPTFGTYSETDKVRMYSIDIEAVRSFKVRQTKIDASFGARHASLDVNSELIAFGVITTGNFANINLANGFAFDGSGLTGGLTLRRQLGSSPFSFFIGGRSSKMWGRTDSYGRSAGAVASGASAPLVGAATVTRNNAESDLVIWEGQIGAQVEFELRRIPAAAFFRVAFEYQNWDITGPPTGGAGFGGTLGTLTTTSFSAAGLGDTEIVGASVATGLTW